MRALAKYVMQMQKQMNLTLSETREINIHDIVALYQANKWSSADKPDELYKVFQNSHSLQPGTAKN
ncbi:hypothetical protein [Pontibacter sp. SGAir0037]|uniref:hypothetical protein n=1 Tax=Pontibacter sp. SGAir0037 TaxID=2571030 RepID=UPI0010F69A27|nr:hypothetical protein [Pontibacter sp. SGAir0037]